MSPKGKLVHDLFDQLSQKLDQGIKKSKARFRLINASLSQSTSAMKESYETLANENQKLHAHYENQVKKIQKEIKSSEAAALKQKIELLNQLHQEYLLVIDQVSLAPLQEYQNFSLEPLLSQLNQFALDSLEDTVSSLSQPIYETIRQRVMRIMEQTQQLDGLFDDYVNQDIWSYQDLEASILQLESVLVNSIEQFKNHINALCSNVSDIQNIAPLLKELNQESKHSETQQAQKEKELKALESALAEDLNDKQNALSQLRKDTYQRLSEPFQSVIESESQDVARLQNQLKQMQLKVMETKDSKAQKSLLNRYDKLLKLYRKTKTGQLDFAVDKELKKAVSEHKNYVAKRHEQYGQDRMHLIQSRVQDTLKSRVKRYRSTLITHQNNNSESIKQFKTLAAFMDSYLSALIPVFKHVYALESTLQNTVKAYVHIQHNLKEKFINDVQTTLVLTRKELAIKASLLYVQTMETEVTYDKISYQVELESSKLKHYHRIVSETQTALAQKAAILKSNLDARFQAKSTVLGLENYLSRIDKEQQIHQQKLDMIHAFERNLIKAKALRVTSDYQQQSESLELEIVRQIEMIDAQMELAQNEHLSRIQTLEEDHQQEIDLIHETIESLERVYRDKLTTFTTQSANETQALEIALESTQDRKTRKKLRKKLEEVTLRLKANTKAVAQEMSTDYDVNFYKNKLELVKKERDEQLKDAQHYYDQEVSVLTTLMNEAKDKLNIITKPSSSRQKLDQLESENSALLDQRLQSQLVTAHQQWERMIKIPQEKLEKAKQNYDQLLEVSKATHPNISHIKQQLEPEYESLKQQLKEAFDKKLNAKNEALSKHHKAHQALLSEIDTIQFNPIPAEKVQAVKAKASIELESNAFEKRLLTILDQQKRALDTPIQDFDKATAQSHALLKSLNKDEVKWLQASIKNL